MLKALSVCTHMVRKHLHTFCWGCHGQTNVHVSLANKHKVMHGWDAFSAVKSRNDISNWKKIRRQRRVDFYHFFSKMMLPPTIERKKNCLAFSPSTCCTTFILLFNLFSSLKSFQEDILFYLDAQFLLFWSELPCRTFTDTLDKYLKTVWLREHVKCLE